MIRLGFFLDEGCGLIRLFLELIRSMGRSFGKSFCGGGD